ncbi:MAG: DUF1501 domain-containing protein [Candidatus Sumerlaeaceae bacterium]|nr:DUF1501 domain-containing protein [Candidatus Sumerlaeaceae bacterium]
MKECLLCTRRQFLGTASLLAAGAAMPQFLARAAAAVESGKVVKGFHDDRILLVVQLGGGNDGLNMVVPYSDDAYYRARPKIGLKQDRLIKINDQIGLNNRMTAMKDLMDGGKVTLIEGVGYPNPNRSHFRSMEIWHTATDSNKFSETGWLGRYFDNQCGGEAEPVAGVAIGGERPQAFGGKKGFGVAFQDPGSFGWTEGQGQAREENYKLINTVARPHNDTLDFLQKVTNDAVLSSDRVREVAKKYKGGISYPRDPFGQSLETVAKMIAGGLPTKIYYVTLSGFDTHANQVGTQDNLLDRFSKGIDAFYKDMKAQGNGDRVLIMTFSEFGRRVEENASGGTDHGTAAPMMLIGDPVVAGMAGKRPSLTDLDQGDLKYTTDFRSVYASVLDQWLHTDSKIILGQGFPQINMVKGASAIKTA